MLKYPKDEQHPKIKKMITFTSFEEEVKRQQDEQEDKDGEDNSYVDSDHWGGQEHGMSPTMIKLCNIYIVRTSFPMGQIIQDVFESQPGVEYFKRVSKYTAFCGFGSMFEEQFSKENEIGLSVEGIKNSIRRRINKWLPETNEEQNVNRD